MRTLPSAQTVKYGLVSSIHDGPPWPGTGGTGPLHATSPAATATRDITGRRDRHRAPSHQDLSQRRAAAVVKYPVGKGVARDRLDSVGFGQTRPIADNDTDQGRATHRRVEFVIVDSPTGVDVKPADQP